MTLLRVIEGGATTDARARHSSPSGWTNAELAEFWRCIRMLGRLGLSVSFEHGSSDEDDPWAAFTTEPNDDLVLHLMRERGRVRLICPPLGIRTDGATVREAVSRLLEHPSLSGLAGATIGKTATGNLRLHPAVLLFAAIVLAVAASGDAAASEPNSSPNPAFGPSFDGALAVTGTRNAEIAPSAAVATPSTKVLAEREGGTGDRLGLPRATNVLAPATTFDGIPLLLAQAIVAGLLMLDREGARAEAGLSNPIPSSPPFAEGRGQNLAHGWLSLAATPISDETSPAHGTEQTPISPLGPGAVVSAEETVPNLLLAAEAPEQRERVDAARPETETATVPWSLAQGVILVAMAPEPGPSDGPDKEASAKAIASSAPVAVPGETGRKTIAAGEHLPGTVVGGDAVLPRGATPNLPADLARAIASLLPTAASAPAVHPAGEATAVEVPWPLLRAQSEAGAIIADFRHGPTDGLEAIRAVMGFLGWLSDPQTKVALTPAEQRTVWTELKNVLPPAPSKDVRVLLVDDGPATAQTSVLMRDIVVMSVDHFPGIEAAIQGDALLLRLPEMPELRIVGQVPLGDLVQSLPFVA